MAGLVHLVLPLAVALALTGHPATARNRVTATRDADRLLKCVVLPPGRAQPTVQPGLVSCPRLIDGPKIRLVLRGAERVLARASFAADSVGHSLVSTRRTPISFSVRGHR